MMYWSKERKDSSTVARVDLRSSSIDDKDIPIYVIESEIRIQQRADEERIKNERKRLKKLENAQRRNEIIKVFWSCDFIVLNLYCKIL